ncbi:MAG: hypothetical protein CMJ05_07615 [Pelagibacterales bacterium]|nr:hypothetical protein [Pelagibacterales bacterium]
MKLITLFISFLCVSNSFSQYKAAPPGEYIGLECDEKLLESKLYYTASQKLKNLDEFYTDEFKSNLKRVLILEISSSITTSTTISSSNSLKDIIGKKKRESKARITAIGAAVFPKYMICDNGDFEIAFIIVNRREYQKAQFDNFKRTLVFHARNLNNLISRMDTSVSKNFLKQKVKFYTTKMDEIGALLPLIELNGKDEVLMQEFSINVSRLENMYDQLRQKKRFKFKELLDKAKDGINNIIEGI